MKPVCWSLLALAALLETLFFSMLLLGDLRLHLVEAILLYVVSSSVYLVSVYVVLKKPGGGGLTLILGAALLFRLTVWPLFPAFSDDPFRYRWEGKLQAHGGNPYQARPADPEWAHLKDAAYDRVAGKDFKGGYGPLVELMQHGMYRAAAAITPDPLRQVFWFKLPYALFDLGVIAALWALLRARRLPVERVLIYAWSPLPMVEFWATGHNDSVPVLFVLLAMLAAARERWTLSLAALSLAAAAKLWPLLLFPIFIGWEKWRPQRWRHGWVIFPIAGLLSLPYWSNVTENIRFMSGFVGGWRNNDSLFGLLYWLTADQYHAKYLAFGVIFAAVALVTLLRLPLEKAALTAITVMLMVSANCHPWYLTWILPLLAFVPVPALLLWTALMPLAYQVLFRWVELGEWDGSTEIRWYIYIPVFALLAGSWLTRWLKSGGESRRTG